MRWGVQGLQARVVKSRVGCHDVWTSTWVFEIYATLTLARYSQYAVPGTSQMRGILLGKESVVGCAGAAGVRGEGPCVGKQ